MKYISLLIIVFCFSLTTEAQKKNTKGKDTFLQQVDSLRMFLDVYSKLSPFASELDANENLIPLALGGDVYEQIGYVNTEIVDRLLKILNDKKVLNYNIDSLLNHDALSFSHSSDKRLWFFSIDEKTGGSFRSALCIIHYRPMDGIVRAELMGDNDSGAASVSYYDGVFQPDSSRLAYITTGSVITCNTCVNTFALQITLDSTSYSKEVIFSFDGRYPDLFLLEYDEITNECHYDYQDAFNDDSLYGSDGGESYRYRYTGRYAYLNGRFVEVEMRRVLVE